MRPVSPDRREGSWNFNAQQSCVAGHLGAIDDNVPPRSRWPCGILSVHTPSVYVRDLNAVGSYCTASSRVS